MDYYGNTASGSVLGDYSRSEELKTLDNLSAAATQLRGSNGQLLSMLARFEPQPIPPDASKQGPELVRVGYADTLREISALLKQQGELIEQLQRHI